METIDKASQSAHETVDKVASAAYQDAEALGKKGEQLKNAKKQLMENCRGYIRDNPVRSLGLPVAAFRRAVPACRTMYVHCGMICAG